MTPVVLTEDQAQHLIALGVPLQWTPTGGWEQISDEDARTVVEAAL